MNIHFQNQIDLMVSNCKELKKLTWATGYARHFMAMYLAQKGAAPDVERIIEINRYTKEKTGLFSAFRAESMYFMSAILSLEEDYQLLFGKMLEVYQLLRDAGFRQSSFLTIAAYVIGSQCGQEEYDRIINDMQVFFQQLQSTHPLITGYDDYAAAAVIAASGKDVCGVAGKMESLYQALDCELHMFGQRNTLQAVCGMLALSEENTDALAARYVEAVHLTREKGIRLGLGGYGALAAVVMLSGQLDEDIRELCEGEAYLKGFRGFGNFALTRELRFSLVGNLLLSVYDSQEAITTAGVATHMISLIMAQQAAIIAANAAAASAAATNG